MSCSGQRIGACSPIRGRSSSEEEDEEGEALTKEVDLEIMKTIAMIKNKDKRVYDPNFKPFEGMIKPAAKKEKKKQMTYKDMVRENALKGGGVEDEVESDRRRGDDMRDKPLTYNQEQEAIKQAFLKSAADPANEAGDDFLQVKEKSAEELRKEKESFSAFLKQESKRGNKDANIVEQLFSEPAKDENEKFLRNYVLNKGWMDDTVDSSAMTDRFGHAQKNAADDDESEEEHLEKVDSFESQYNFRFEEAGSSQVVTHARHVEGSIRRKGRQACQST